MVRKSTAVVLRQVNFADYTAEIRRAMDVYNAAWTRNWGFVPLTEAEFVYAAKQLRPVLERFPEGAMVAEVGGRPIAFCLAVLDVNQALARLPGGRLFPFRFWALLRRLRRGRPAPLMAPGIPPQVPPPRLHPLPLFQNLSPRPR